MSAKSIKVLAVGDVNGKFQELLKKVSTVNKKSGPFDLLICVGEFFGPDQQLNQKVASGEINFPIPTYILGPCCPSTSQFFPEENAEFSPNLTYLGRKGILNTASGLTIAYLSGIETSGSSPRPFEFSEKNIDDLLLPVRSQVGFLGVDILLTSVWPADVAKFSPNTPMREITGSKLLSRLATGLKPRYHFSGLGCHYERTPYRNHRVLVEPAQHTTRFIGLSSVGNEEKEKWIYAFNLVPMRKMSKDELTTQPPNSSEFPYMDILQEFILRKREEDMKKSENQFFFDMNAGYEEEEEEDRGRKRKNNSNDERQVKKISTEKCWFCLSNVKTERHLIVAIGEKSYCAMPKGPLTDDHVLILSIDHVQSMVTADEKLREEVKKFKDAFSLMANGDGKVLVCFERNYKCSHMQIQIVPVSKSKSRTLKSSFMNAAQLAGIELTIMEEKDQVWDLVFEGTPYFCVELPDGTRLFTRQMNKFPLQFGREVLAGPSLLDCEEKVDWKNCLLGEEKETEFSKFFWFFKPQVFQILGFLFGC
ncbi:hypothetical protein FO519_006283 [Halicephalobus sp. NKZ332]|nr:hypothetical protein FO519_006283 [Halicephalobus sp. NKZ332]